jgi:hypothetical protein
MHALAKRKVNHRKYMDMLQAHTFGYKKAKWYQRRFIKKKNHSQADLQLTK